eukprot:TRINITY_DN1823_c0_g1_i1.p2 TRINITY_DN1823_c0_g1~~TRINITY_DN1823_c0_g1_i1.p2  ORF type:complete len:247 (-),score=10.37 TRINITY_DN1823_c0_g1_i1:170-910(-)
MIVLGLLLKGQFLYVYLAQKQLTFEGFFQDWPYQQAFLVFLFVTIFYDLSSGSAKEDAILIVQEKVGKESINSTRESEYDINHQSMKVALLVLLLELFIAITEGKRKTKTLRMKKEAKEEGALAGLKAKILLEQPEIYLDCRYDYFGHLMTSHWFQYIEENVVRAGLLIKRIRKGILPVVTDPFEEPEELIGDEFASYDEDEDGRWGTCDFDKFYRQHLEELAASYLENNAQPSLPLLLMLMHEHN